MNTGDTDTIHIESPKLIGPAVNYQPVKLVYGHGLPCVTNKLGSDDYKKCKKISLHFHENGGSTSRYQYPYEVMSWT